MKKFCCGDVVPGWSPVSDSPSDSSLYEVYSAHVFRDHTLGSAKAAFADELRSNIPEATAA